MFHFLIPSKQKWGVGVKHHSPPKSWWKGARFQDSHQDYQLRSLLKGERGAAATCQAGSCGHNGVTGFLVSPAVLVSAPGAVSGGCSWLLVLRTSHPTSRLTQRVDSLVQETYQLLCWKLKQLPNYRCGLDGWKQQRVPGRSGWPQAVQCQLLAWCWFELV